MGCCESEPGDGKRLVIVKDYPIAGTVLGREMVLYMSGPLLLDDECMVCTDWDNGRSSIVFEDRKRVFLIQWSYIRRMWVIKYLMPDTGFAGAEDPLVRTGYSSFVAPS